MTGSGILSEFRSDRIDNSVRDKLWISSDCTKQQGLPRNVLSLASLSVKRVMVVIQAGSAIVAS